jgi:hypothetical protein
MTESGRTLLGCSLGGILKHSPRPRAARVPCRASPRVTVFHRVKLGELLVRQPAMQWPADRESHLHPTAG